MVTERFGRETTGNRIRLTDRLFRILLVLRASGASSRFRAFRLAGRTRCTDQLLSGRLARGARSGTGATFWLRDPRTMRASTRRCGCPPRRAAQPTAVPVARVVQEQAPSVPPGGCWAVPRSGSRASGLGVKTHALGGTPRVGAVTLVRARQDHLVLSGSAITSSDPVGCFLARCAEIHWTTGAFTVRYEGARKRVNSHEDQARNRPKGRLFRDDQPVVACSNGLFAA